MAIEVNAFYDARTGTVTYVVADLAARACAVIDSVLGFDPRSGQVDRASHTGVIAFVERHCLRLDWILETHLHADHLSGASELKEALGGAIGIGAGIAESMLFWTPLFGASPVAEATLGFDRLLADGETLALGGTALRVISTPGHTPDGVTYVIEDNAFVGDTLLMPNAGTARCDFPGGCPRTLYQSVLKIFELPQSTRLFCGHDYGPARGEAPGWESSVRVQRSHNVHVHDGVSESQFIEKRTARDQSLSAPALLFPALQVNLRAGRLPPNESNGIAYLKLPLNLNLDSLRANGHSALTATVEQSKLRPA